MSLATGLFALSASMVAIQANAQAPFRVKELTPGPAGTQFLRVEALGARLLFMIELYDGYHIPTLWVTDGTEAGTAPLHTMTSQYLPDVPRTVGNQLFFADDYQLWKTDGTTAGTVLVKDFYPDGRPGALTRVGD